MNTCSRLSDDVVALNGKAGAVPMSNSWSVAIIGAGVGGLSMAKLLKEAGIPDVAVFEAAGRVGGKSFSVMDYRSPVEMGTCYTTRAHKRVKDWMRDYGIGLKRNGLAKYDGQSFRRHVQTGAGPHALIQMFRFLREADKLQKRIEEDPQNPAVRAEASMTILEWLRARDLPKMELFLHRIQTVMGYGFLDETTAAQAQRWCNLSLVLSGFFNQMHMPESGWEPFWRRVADDVGNVFTNAAVTGIDRAPHGVTLQTAKGVHTAQYLINTIPLDTFASLCTLSDDEKIVMEGVEWGGYTTSLVTVDDWFTDYQVDGYSETVRPGAELGQMVGARLEARDPELGPLYVTGQLPGRYTEPELAELLRSDIIKRKGKNPNVIMNRTWRYFPRWTTQAVREGLLGTMVDLQGDNRTWHSGSTFAFEAVSHIVEHNAALAPRIAAAFAAATPQRLAA